ncbi:MAG TPA: ATP-binding protein [Gammaproteobacteria bacterium]|nr:ATP-binding protein [Gammaproteobacteria bacterium]
MSAIIGRELELSLLQKTLKSDQAEFIAVYGRRRVGKTYLLTTFFHNKGAYFEFSGINDADLKTQLKSFCSILARTFDMQITKMPKDWLDALDLLLQQINLLAKDQKIILFFDELPWIATPKSNFLSALDNLWNRYLSRMPHVILVVCGSAASWMLDNIISNTGGLYGRLTRKLHLLPFTLQETKQLLASRNIELDHKQIIELYMTMGGIPKYLAQIEPGKSVTQTISEQFFTRVGYLAGEFHKLYASLFKNYEKHIKIVRVLAKSHSGFTRDELLDKAGIGTGGTASKILRELEESGFILHFGCYNSKKALAKYRLIDQYSLFYLKWIEPHERQLFATDQANYWLQQINSNAWQSWCGYAFENICLLHLDKIQDALGLRGIHVTAHTWYLKGDHNKTGAQIDLLLDRADNCMNLCEIKFYNQVFEITKPYAEELNAKKEIFRMGTNSKKSLFTTIISTYGIQDNARARESVQSQVTIEALF